MVQLLSPRTRGARPAGRRPTSLWLETLESRDAPASITIEAVYGTGRNVTFSGTLSGCANPSGLTVSLSGQASGSAVTDSHGEYSVTLQAGGTGTVSAYVMVPPSGPGGMPSGASASVTLTDSAPVLNEFDAVELPDHYWSFHGTFSYFRYWESMTVVIWGQPVTVGNTQVTGDANGYFELMVQLNGTTTDNGQVWAKVISPYGTDSNVMTDLVSQTGV